MPAVRRPAPNSSSPNRRVPAALQSRLIRSRRQAWRTRATLNRHRSSSRRALPLSRSDALGCMGRGPLREVRDRTAPPSHEAAAGPPKGQTGRKSRLQKEVEALHTDQNQCERKKAEAEQQAQKRQERNDAMQREQEDKKKQQKEERKRRDEEKDRAAQERLSPDQVVWAVANTGHPFWPALVLALARRNQEIARHFDNRTCANKRGRGHTLTSNARQSTDPRTHPPARGTNPRPRSPRQAGELRLPGRRRERALLGDATFATPIAKPTKHRLQEDRFAVSPPPRELSRAEPLPRRFHRSLMRCAVEFCVPKFNSHPSAMRAYSKTMSH